LKLHGKICLGNWGIEMYESTEIIKIILNEFDSSNLDYAIIRNYGFLSDDNEQVGKDVDIVIEEEKANEFGSILTSNGFFRQPISPHSSHSGFWKYLPEEKKLVKFHFHEGGISGNSIPYLKAKQVLERRRKMDSFYVISDEDLLINILFHSKLSGEKARYAPLVRELRKKRLDTSYVFNSIKDILGRELSKNMFHAYKELNFEKLDNLKPEIKKSLVMRNPFPVFRTLFLSSLWKIGRLIKPSPLVCFIGMDGSGKSTVTSNLSDVFKKNKLKSSLIYTGRGRNNLLPIQFFGRKYKAKEKKEETSEKRSNKSLKKKLIYSLAAPVFALDLYLRYLKDIFPKRIKDEIVIVDRYATDLLLMKNVNNKLRKVLYSIFPKPTMVFYLYNDPELLYQRKPGHPAGDLERQEKLFDMILPTLDNLNKIKSESEKQTLDDVSNLLFPKFLNH